MTKVNLDSVSLFRAKNRALADAAVGILEREKPMNLRQLFYRLISAGGIHNRQAEYKRLGGRQAGGCRAGRTAATSYRRRVLDKLAGGQEGGWSQAHVPSGLGADRYGPR